MSSSRVQIFESRAMRNFIRFGFHDATGDTMTKKPQQRTADDPEQSKRFIEAARKAEADETETGADRAFKKVVPRKQEGSQKRAR